MKAGKLNPKQRRKLVIMNIIIAVLVIINAMVVVATIENGRGEGTIYTADVVMQYLADDKYGNAADYANRDSINSQDYAMYNGRDNQLNESIAAADYYRFQLRKSVYETEGQYDKALEMQRKMDTARENMGTLSPLQKKIDAMLSPQ